MKTNQTSARMVGALIVTAFLAAFILVVAAYGPGSNERIASAQRSVGMAPAHETETRHPDETETHHPEATETEHPESTETHHPNATETEHPQSTRTGEPEETETVEPQETETHHPETTRTAEIEPTETHHPEGTRTVEGTRTPEGTETAEPSHTSLPAPSTTAAAGGSSGTIPGTGTRIFPQTGRSVGGIFLSYWDGNGGLAQQGLPISGISQERSDLDGKTYTVQYFERAVFEYHPELAGNNKVLLSQLGTFRYKSLYPAGAPRQAVNNTNARFFPETKHTVGGVFRTYWEQNGGLAQQGFPISEEFTEVSPLDGKSYTVQYFERAVFELHPENKAPFDVLLSQLGTFRLNGQK
ncbi:MAG: hypothetical protein ABI670_05670 [Chloroflexota bacterium]